MGPLDIFLWRVFDCDSSQFRTDVVWVDDDLNQYAHYPNGVIRVMTYDELNIVKAKVLILQDIKLVYLNPKLDKDELESEETRTRNEIAPQQIRVPALIVHHVIPRRE